MDQIVLTMDSASTTSAAMAAMTSASSASAMDMGGGCKISMLWNWNTIDSCFIASSWRITSHGMFAGSCIGVILLVMALEFLRKTSKQYDRYILDRFKRDIGSASASAPQQPKIVTTTTMPTNKNNDQTCCSGTDDDSTNNGQNQQKQQQQQQQQQQQYHPPSISSPNTRFRPTLAQQSIRALLHTVTFAVAYFVMLLAMYYNGYFIICIFIGAYLGSFVFTWESISVSTGYVSYLATRVRIDRSSSAGSPATEEVTVCCG